MATPEPERERSGLLAKQVTFTERPGSHHPSPGSAAAASAAGAESQDLITKVFGTKNANNQRVSESLDYEPVQNKIFYDRIKAAKEKRHLAAFGCVGRRRRARVAGRRSHTRSARAERRQPAASSPTWGALRAQTTMRRRALRRTNDAPRTHQHQHPRTPPQRATTTSKTPPKKHYTHPKTALHQQTNPKKPTPKNSYTGHTLAKFVVTLLTGIVTGMFAVGLSRAVHHAFEAKNAFIQTVLDQPGPAAARLWTAFGWHALYSSALVALAVALVQYWAPQAAGAGVTLVMAYLNGNHVPNLLRLRTLVTKFVGTICSVSAGLPMGPEGPMVHIGACVASVITYAQCSESLCLSSAAAAVVVVSIMALGSSS
jgi:hypothetical protein